MAVSGIYLRFLGCNSKIQTKQATKNDVGVMLFGMGKTNGIFQSITVHQFVMVYYEVIEFCCGLKGE